MAKSNLNIPATEFKTEFEPGTIGNLVGDGEGEIKQRDLLMVPLDRISLVKDFNVRIHDPDYEAHIERIKDSMKANGFYRHNPVKAYVGKEGDQDLFYLVGGYTRFEAAKRAVKEGADIPRIPVVPVPKGTSMKDLMYGLEIDNDGKQLSPFERGIVIKRLVAMDETEDDIAKGMGITKQYVTDLLSLMSAPRALHNMVTSGEVSARLAMDTIRKEGSGKKAVEVLKSAGATGANAAPGGEGTRVTRTTLRNQGNTPAAAGKKLYEALIEYMIVLGGSSGAQAAYDFLLKWNEKDASAVKELNGIIAKGSKRGKNKKKSETKKPPNPKDVRIKITDTMSDEDKASAREHNKRVKKRKERREAKAAEAAAAAAAAAKAPDAPPKGGGDSDDDPL
jgi:hypothetical protein